MTGNWFYDTDLILIFAVTILVFSCALAAGYHLGRKASKLDGSDSQIHTLQGAALGLLGLLLAFTFAMSADRFSTRRQLVVDESNAIGTAFLRTKLLPEPFQTQLGALLRGYVNNRLEFYEASNDPLKLQQAAEKSTQIQDQLWQQTMLINTADPHSIPSGLFTQSLNEVIDLNASRMAALKNRIPDVILILLFMAAIVTLGLMGYGTGLDQHRNFIPPLMMLILIAFTLLVIIDLDSPRTGLIRISQDSMFLLQQSLK